MHLCFGLLAAQVFWPSGSLFGVNIFGRACCWGDPKMLVYLHTF